MKLTQLILSIILLFPTLLFSQSIENVQSKLSENKVIVTYDISGGRFFNYYQISLFVSRDNGKTFIGPLREVTGDVGENIRRGSHQIIWEAMKELPFTDDSFVFDVRAEVLKKHIKPSFFVSYNANTTTPIGLRVGMIGRFGWYVESRMNLKAFNSAEFTYKDGDIIDYNLPGYYAYTSERGYSAFTVLGGGIFQTGRNVFINAGVGYAWENYLYEIANYSYENDQLTGTSYVVDDDYNLSGFEIDAGLMYRYKILLFNAGVTTLNFQNVWWTAGIGVVF